MNGPTVDSQAEIEPRGRGSFHGLGEIKFGRLALLVICMAISFLWSNAIRLHNPLTSFMDFREIYYGSLSAIHHQDPYNPAIALRTFREHGGQFPQKDGPVRLVAIIVTTIQVNMPTTLFLAAPLALLSLATVQTLWTILTAIALVVAAYLVWDLAGGAAPILCGTLIGIVLADCEQMLNVGNVAGLVVSLGVIAAWCFFRNRWVYVGIACLTLALAIKPHDVGFVWLYFLLAGGVLRKRSLQTLAVTAAVGLAAALWLAPASPHWFGELHANHVVVSAAGSTSDPSPAGLTSGDVGSVLDLQSAFSVFLPDPRYYNLASYLVFAPLFGLWAWTALRRRDEGHRVWQGLAAVAVLTLLPVYHRPYDAKLLLLAIPACAQLWCAGGVKRWVSCALTTAGVLLTSDIPRGALIALFETPSKIPHTHGHEMVGLSIVTPAVLLAMACFYLYEYVRGARTELVLEEFRSANQMLTSASELHAS